MIVSRVKVKNWRNFRTIDVGLRDRQFLVGPNASGKSNFLDIFRFLRDIAKPEGGGLQKAIKDRGGVSKVRSLYARKDPEISIEVELADGPDSKAEWRYAIGIKQEPRALRLPYVSFERVWKDGQRIVN